jgi:hypothetical protein
MTAHILLTNDKIPVDELANVTTACGELFSQARILCNGEIGLYLCKDCIIASQASLSKYEYAMVKHG